MVGPTAHPSQVGRRDFHPDAKVPTLPCFSALAALYSPPFPQGGELAAPKGRLGKECTGAFRPLECSDQHAGVTTLVGVRFSGDDKENTNFAVAGSLTLNRLIPTFSNGCARGLHGLRGLQTGEMGKRKSEGQRKKDQGGRRGRLSDRQS